MALKSSNSATWNGRSKQGWCSSDMSSLMGEAVEANFSSARQTSAGSSSSYSGSSSSYLSSTNRRLESSYQQVSLPLELPRNSRFTVEKQQRRSRNRVTSVGASMTQASASRASEQVVTLHKNDYFTYQDVMETAAVAADTNHHQRRSKTVLLGPNTPVSLSISNQLQGRASDRQLRYDSSSANVNDMAAVKLPLSVDKQTDPSTRVYRQYDMFDTVASVQALQQDGIDSVDSVKSNQVNRKRQSQRSAALRSISHILNTRLDNRHGLHHSKTITMSADSDDSENSSFQDQQETFSDASRLKALLENSHILWRGDALTSNVQGWSSGYLALDEILPTKGWPAKSIIEVLTPAWGIGELKLLLPRMREVTQKKQWVIWISPPYQPYAPALLQAGVDLNYVIVIDPKTSCKDAIWSMEKALQTQACAMILAWTNWLPNGVVRRLQLAAEKGGGMAFLFRERETKNSPAALRLQLQPHRQGVTVEVLKARGSYQYKSVVIPLAG